MAPPMEEPEVPPLFSDVSDAALDAGFETTSGSTSGSTPEFGHSAGSLDLRKPQPSNLHGVIRAGDPAAFAEGVRDNLGLVQRFFYDSRMQSIQRKQAIKIAQTLFEAEYQALIHKLMLGLDITKKRIFIEYLRANKDLQSDIQRLAADAVGDLADVLVEVREKAYVNAVRQAERVRESVRKGVLSEQQGRAELEVVANLRDANLNDAVHTYKTLRDNTMSLLETSLRLFKDAITEEKLISDH